MNLFSYLFCFVFAFNIVSAGTMVCIDLDSPSAPGNLGVSGEVGSILLTWDAAVDEPSCSGIAYYNISRNGKWLGLVGGDVLSFVDNESLGEGSYSYTVHAIDLVGGNAGASILNEIEVEKGGRVSGGSSSTSFQCEVDWVCEDWTECVGNEQRRLCNDLNYCGTINMMPETYRECGLMSEAQNLTFVDVEGEREDGDGFFSSITGAVTGAIGTPQGIAASIFIILVLCGLIIIVIKRKNFKK